MPETPTDRARAIILSGEPFFPIEVSRQVRRSNGFAAGIKRDLTFLGYEFGGARPGPFWCLNPAHRPTEEAMRALREKRRIAQGLAPNRAKPRAAALTPEQLEQRRARDREYKARARERRLAADTAASPRMEVARLDDHDDTRHDVPSHSVERFSGNGILGIPGFERAEPMNYRATLNSIPPALASGVQVFAMALQDDGTLRLGIQNGERKWVVDVVAEVER